jgi:hypothetical protein
MNGAFCAACGTRAKTGDAPAAQSAMPPQAPMQAAPVVVASKTSPLVWILVAVAGLFVLGIVSVIGTGFFVMHKAKEAGFDSDLMRRNPGLAVAKLVAATNPDLEVVSVDDGKGRITIREKSTGKTTTVTFDEMKRGKFTFHEEGKDAVTLEANGDNQSFQMKSGTESMTLGANQATLPAWIPAYPGAKAQSNFSMKGKDGDAASFQFQTQDALKDVIAFYENGLKQNGMKITATSTTDSGGTSSGLVSAADDSNKRTAVVTVSTDAKGTAVSVSYSQR